LRLLRSTLWTSRKATPCASLRREALEGTRREIIE
jgi:hypothetical protein